MTLAAGRRARYLAEVLILAIAIRCAELWRVGEVEALRPELEPPRFAKGKVLEQRKVNIPGGRTVVALQTEIAAG